MREGRDPRHGRIGLHALMLLATLVGCGRHDRKAAGSGEDSTHAQARIPAGAPAPEAHVAPAQPTGPQVGRGDPLINRLRPRLEEWAVMWRNALPGFELDSLWAQDHAHWAAVYSDTLDSLTKLRDSPEDLAFDLLGLPSPDRRHILDIDSYQVIEPFGDQLEIGGEPDSKTDLFDLKRRRVTTLQVCGTGGGAHWAVWIDADRFALGQWREADDFGEWYQGQLSIYSLADSSVSSYATRIVPASDFARYRTAWEAWVDKRYREFKASRSRS